LSESGGNVLVSTNLIPASLYNVGGSSNYWNNAYLTSVYNSGLYNYGTVTYNMNNSSANTGYPTMPALTRYYYTSTVSSNPSNTKVLEFNLPSGKAGTNVATISGGYVTGTAFYPFNYAQNASYIASALASPSTIQVYTSSSWSNSGSVTYKIYFECT
jgi:hypothetical protein